MAGVRNPVAFAREHTGDAQADRMQQVSQRLAMLTKQAPFLNGVLLDGGNGDGSGPGVVVGATATIINHGLGREPRGFIVLDTRGNGVTPVWAVSASQPRDLTKQFALIASASVTVKLWVW